MFAIEIGFNISIGMLINMQKEPTNYVIRSRYNRIAFIYDLMEAPIERWRFASWRSKLRERIRGNRILEVGVGTGKNLLYYHKDVKIIAIDFSKRMLERARTKAGNLDLSVEFLEMDAQNLAFPDQFFDTIFATFVFCSVPDPVAGFRELRRVCKPDGKLILLEHMRPDNDILGFIFDLINPLVVRMVGANINRRTVDSIRKAGWQIQMEERLSSDIIRWIEATPRI
jgi:ubiquinone/menaquinone biosynthesis C-methylase UbiE